MNDYPGDVNYEMKRTVLDGNKEWKMKCPGCEAWGFIDDDQYHGRVSIDCLECDYHETVNLAVVCTEAT